MNLPYHPDEHEDLANPRPRRAPLVLVALVVGLLVLGASVLVFFLAR